MIVNCTFIDNKARYGGAIYNDSQSTPTIYNSIFYGNKNSSNNSVDNISGNANVANSLVEGGFTGGQNIIDEDPDLDDNYFPKEGSPVINAGDNQYYLTAYGDKDIVGNTRVVNTIDMGAFEYQSEVDEPQEIVTATWKHEYTTDTKEILLKASQSKKVTIDWGHGNQSVITGKGEEEITVAYSDYPVGTYNISITAEAGCKITSLSIQYAAMTSLDITKAPSLRYLSCWRNELTSLDLSKNTELTELTCSDNFLTSINISKNTKLTNLSCYSTLYNNPDEIVLTSLDVSNNPHLTRISCYGNALTSLDLSNNTELTDLLCTNNQLTSLDLTNNTKLTGLYCQENALTDLDITHNPSIESLFCFQNAIPLESLYAISEKVTTVDRKRLGTQNIPLKNIAAGQSALLTNALSLGNPPQNTSFVVRNSGNIASVVHYSINNGSITFHNPGIYSVEMTNDAIVSHDNYPALVIAHFDVTEGNNLDAIDSDNRYSAWNQGGKLYVQSQEAGLLQIFNVSGAEIIRRNISNEEYSFELTQGIYIVVVNSEPKKVAVQ